jgi:hypothetical protein
LGFRLSHPPYPADYVSSLTVALTVFGIKCNLTLTFAKAAVVSVAPLTLVENLDDKRQHIRSSSILEPSCTSLRSSLRIGWKL